MALGMDLLCYPLLGLPRVGDLVSSYALVSVDEGGFLFYYNSLEGRNRSIIQYCGVLLEENYFLFAVSGFFLVLCFLK